ncbi:hypothetical protein FOZ62_012431, partial [Perkinsus olseni]
VRSLRCAVVYDRRSRYWYGTTQGCPPSLPYGWRDEYTTHSEGGEQDEVIKASGDVERRGSMPTNITCRISTAILTKHIPRSYSLSVEDKPQRIPRSIYQTMESAVMPVRMAQ